VTKKAEQICKNCIYFLLFEELKKDEGRCRRYAPSPMWKERIREWEFPVVKFKDTCGEYKKK